MKIFPLASAGLSLLVATVFATGVSAATVGEDGLVAVNSDARYDILHNPARANLRSLRKNHARTGDEYGAPDDGDDEAVVEEVRRSIISCNHGAFCVYCISVANVRARFFLN